MRTVLLALLASVHAGVAFAPSALAADPAPKAKAASAQALSAQDPAFAARIDAVVDQAIADKRLVGAVVLIARDGKVIYRRAAGLADREKNVPMREDAIFRLASVSKPIVSTAVMRLVDQGKLRLDDPVSRWLPYFRPKLADGTTPVITIRQLLTHTAGIGYRFGEPKKSAYHTVNVLDGMEQPGPSLEENMKRLAQAPLAFKPGSRWHYGLSIDVLGAVIERVTGQPLPQAVQALVTGPLGMADTGFVAKDPRRLTAAYHNAKPAPARMNGVTRVPHYGATFVFDPNRALDPKAFPSGGAGMVGSARDILTLLETVRAGGGSILKPETARAMMSDQVGTRAQTQGPGWGFGYGWAVLVDPAVAKTPQSKGTIQWGGVYGHSWFVDPAKKITVVALTNTTTEGMDGPFVGQLRDAVYGKATPGAAK